MRANNGQQRRIRFPWVVPCQIEGQEVRNWHIPDELRSRRNARPDRVVTCAGALLCSVCVCVCVRVRVCVCVCVQWTLRHDDTVDRLKALIAGEWEKQSDYREALRNFACVLTAATPSCVSCVADRVGIPPHAQRLITRGQASTNEQASSLVPKDAQTLGQVGLGGGCAVWLVRA